MGEGWMNGGKQKVTVSFLVCSTSLLGIKDQTVESELLDSLKTIKCSFHTHILSRAG